MAAVQAALKKAPTIVPSYINTAIKKSILFVQGNSQTRTPVDTGRLRGSYDFKFGNLYGETGPNTNYAIYVHEGTRYMPSRPFLQQALNSSRGAINKWFEQELNNALEKIAREAK